MVGGWINLPRISSLILINKQKKKRNEDKRKLLYVYVVDQLSQNPIYPKSNQIKIKKKEPEKETRGRCHRSLAAVVMFSGLGRRKRTASNSHWSLFVILMCGA